MPLEAKRPKRVEKATPADSDIELQPTPLVEEPPPPPRVTALVWSYNNAPALRRCLAALEKSEGRDRLQILVVDKGSQDESATLDEEYPESTFLRLPRHFGNTKALNIALRTAGAELIFFLAPEIEVQPGTVNALAAFLDESAEAVAVAPSIVNAAGDPIEHIFRLPAPATGSEMIPAMPELDDGPVTVEYATFRALMARKYFIRGINYFDERYGEFGSDAELCYQIQRGGRTAVLLPGVRVVQAEPPPQPSVKGAALLEADRIHGAAVYLGKHYGFLSGIGLRTKAALGALTSLRFGLVTSLLTGGKIDGSQTSRI